MLCGGASRRMGRDKALLPVDGVPMARRVADALLAAGASKVVAAGGDEAALAEIGLTVRADTEPGGGPLGAVIDALAVTGGEVVAVLGCDLVSPDPEAVNTVVGELAADPSADVAVPVVDGIRQWHHAAWRRSAVQALRDARAGGIGSLWRAVAGVEVREVTAIAPAAVADADTPADLR